MFASVKTVGAEDYRGFFPDSFLILQQPDTVIIVLGFLCHFNLR